MLALYESMSILPLEVSTGEAEALARDRWGIEGTATPLRGERDRNFRLDAADGRRFVLKFANPAEDAGYRGMQIAAIHHIAGADPGLPVPEAVHLPDGAIEAAAPHASGAIQQARLLTWVHGEPIGQAPATPATRAAFGRLVARLQAALADFDHPSRDFPISWDVQHATHLGAIAHTIEDAAARALVLDVVAEFDRRAVEPLARLPRQIVHNDLNGWNVLVAAADPAAIAGVIDFGDITRTARVCDLAIAAVSAPAGDLPPAEAAAEVIAAYHAVQPLLAEEIDLLPLLMAARFATGLALASWHRHNQPDNAHFDLSPATIARRMGLIDALRASAPVMRAAVSRSG